MLGTSPLLGQALQHAWDMLALGTGPLSTHTQCTHIETMIDFGPKGRTGGPVVCAAKISAPMSSESSSDCDAQMIDVSSAASSSASSESQPPPPPVPCECLFCLNDLCCRVGQRPALYGIRVRRPTDWKEDNTTVAVCGICIAELWRHHTKLELHYHTWQERVKMQPWELDAAYRTNQEVYKNFFPALRVKVFEEAAAKAKSEGLRLVKCWYKKTLWPEAGRFS